ncbi:uncharacterized protein [Phaseolus vulgaris]|uniref:uncharacterized protein n=1 Tax=Phaseolus vulgaris TaxID=3885 RepID=UPI0035CAB373
MTRTKITPNPPPSSRNPPSQAHDPPQTRGASSSQAERPASSRPTQAQAAPPVTRGTTVPPPNFKTLYPWANSTLLRETSSVNTAGAVLRLTKGDEPNQTFHKEHDEKMIVLPCPPDLPVCADDKANNMLGKGMLAELKALARNHGLATGSQTVPNSVVEKAIVHGRSPAKEPAAQRKKLVLKRPKRKAPQVIHEEEEEDDEATEDGLVTKRKRVAPSSPPAPPPLPTSTPPSTPAPPPSSPPTQAPASPVQAIPLATAPPAVEAQEPNFMEDPPSASTPYVSAGGGPPSNASAAEAEPIGDEVAHTSPILITESPIPSPRQQAPTEEPAKEGGDENQQQAPTAPLVPLQAANLPLEVTRMSADREKLLGQVEKARDDAMAELTKINKEKGELAAELGQAQANSKKVAEDLLQAQETKEQLKKQTEELEQQNKGLKEQTEKQIEELQKQIEDLKLNSAQILAAGFEAAREQFACLFPDLDLSLVSLDNEVVDGKVVPAED